MILRLFRYFIYLSAILLICLYVLLATEYGLKSSIRFVLHYLPAEIHYDEINGSYWTGFDIHGMKITADEYSIMINQLNSSHNLNKLLARNISIPKLDIIDMEIIYIQDGEESVDSESIILPIRINVDSFVINKLKILEPSENLSYDINRIKSGFSISDKLRLDHIIVEADNYVINGLGTIDLLAPYHVSMESQWQLNIKAFGDITGESITRGPLDTLDIKTVINKPATAYINTTVNHLLDGPVFNADISIPAHKPDYPDINMDFPFTSIELSANVDGNLDQINTDGSLELNHPEFGQWNAMFISEHHFDNHIILEDLHIRQKDNDNNIRMHGQIVLSDQSYEANLEGNWHFSDLNIPHIEKTVSSESGQFEFTGNHTAYKANINTKLDIESIVNGNLDLLLEGNEYRIEFRQAHANTENGNIDFSGHVDWQSAETDFLLEGNTERYLLTNIRDKKVELQDGEFRMTGSTSLYTLNAKSLLNIEDYPGSELRINLSGNDKQTTIQKFGIKLPKGEINLHGNVEHHKDIIARLSLDAGKIDPAILWNEWPGNIDANGDLVIRYHDNNYSLNIPVLEFKGVLREYPFRLGLNGSYQPDKLIVKTFELTSGPSRLELKGSVTNQYDLEWNLNSPDLNQMSPIMHGNVKSMGKLTGKKSSPAISAKLQAENIKYENYQAGIIDISAVADLVEKGKIDVNISSSTIKLDDYEIFEASIKAEGSANNHIVDFSSIDTYQKINISTRGKLTGLNWFGEIHAINLENKSIGQWKLKQVTPASYQNNLLSTDTLCLENQSASICSALKWNTETHDVEGKMNARQLPFELFKSFYPDDLEVSGLVDANLIASRSNKGQLTAEGDIATTKGHLAISIDDESVEEVSFEPSQLAFSLIDHSLKSELTVNFTKPEVKPITAQLHLENIDIYEPDLSVIKLSGKVNSGIDNLSLFEPLTPHLSDVHGSLLVDIDIAGTASQPIITGDIILSNGEAYVHELGIEIQFALEGKANRLGEYRITGVMHSGEGTIDISAQLSGFDPDTGILTIHLNGKDFEAVSLPEVWALVSPDIVIHMDLRSTSIKGEILIPQAQIDLEHIYIPASVSDDVNILSEKKTARKKDPYKLKTDLNVTLGENIDVTGKGVTGKLKGQLNLFTNNNYDIVADGEIFMQDGSFSMYAQNLEIREGRLIYNKAIIDDPELSIRAAREIGQITAGVRVTGKASDPIVTLFSTPSLSHEEILSYLVFGRPLASLTSGEGVDLISTATTLGLQNSGFITDSIANTFGLDDLKVSTGPNNQDAALVLGKYLTPKLYISYGMGLFETLNTIRLKYDISRRWAVQSESGTYMGVDLLYQIEK